MRLRLSRHALLIIAIAVGILGMGMAFNGAMHGSFREASRGLPLLLIGLWWAGRELGHSMDARRIRRRRGAARASQAADTGTERLTRVVGDEPVIGGTRVRD
ncbi:MAG: hypothetical protein ACRDFS_06380 [Chloroflexota bacterium]